VYKLYLDLEAHSFGTLVIDLLMELRDRLSSFEMRSLELDEFGTLGEGGGKGFDMALIPGLGHLLRDGADGGLVSTVGGWTLRHT
jgi:hypothetical protein